MPKHRLPKPTDGELAILRVLWQRGASTVREIQETFGAKTGYTTVLKLLQIMTEKGLVKRNETSRTHIYEPAEKKEVTQRLLVSDLLQRAFGGSAEKLILHALESKPASEEELARIRKLIEELQRGRS